ncbi:MAG TPA: acetyl-CoA carboxylase biotin carboxyl carrier protein [Gemmatimonadota bacterium]|jgi:acetyl-CoA carboxylase biotin carboxyl carrier protein
MNEREIKRLIRIVEESGIDELEVSRWGRSVRIVKRAANGAEQGAATTVYTVEAGGAGGGKPRPGSAPATAAAGERPGVALLRAPMVGTFYRAPSPEAPAYVDVGDRVRKGQTLCILEAMKLMNEIESEQDGVVRAILAENGEPVEYGQPLFELEPV